MSERTDALQFFESLGDGFDTSKPLRWGFLLGAVPEDRIEALMGKIGALGFTEVEPLFDEDQAGKFVVGFADICVHSAESFIERVEVVKRLAEHENSELYDYSAGRLDLPDPSNHH